MIATARGSLSTLIRRCAGIGLIGAVVACGGETLRTLDPRLQLIRNGCDHWLKGRRL